MKEKKWPSAGRETRFETNEFCVEGVSVWMSRASMGYKAYSGYQLVVSGTRASAYVSRKAVRFEEVVGIRNAQPTELV